MTDAERRAAAKQFAADWRGRGDEKQETQPFWISLLSKVFGVAEPDKFIDFDILLSIFCCAKIVLQYLIIRVKLLLIIKDSTPLFACISKPRISRFYYNLCGME